MKRILTTLSQKWPEYLLEVLVIIVGILGAYALNNWNDGRKIRQDERKIISQLIDEYETNLVQLDSKIEMRSMMSAQAVKIIDFIDAPDTVEYKDVINNVMFFFNDPTLDPIRNDLLGTGNLRVLKNDSLKKLLADWEADFAALNEMELTWQRLAQDLVFPYFLEKGLLRDISMAVFKLPFYQEFMQASDLEIENLSKSIGHSKDPPEVKDLLSDDKLESIAVSLIANAQAANFQSILLRKKMVKTLELLRKEIE